MKRTLKNLKIYWRDMRTRLYDAIFAAGIRMLRTSSGRTRSSETRRRRRVSSPRPENPTRAPSRSNNRTLRPQRQVKKQKQVQRRPVGNRSDPQPGSYKSNSDPAPA